MKISVAIPTHDMVPALFAYDLAALCAFTAAAMPDDVEFGINMVSGTYVHKARQQLINSLVVQGSDYVLWLDSDMRIPRDALVRLLKHKLPMVGINYAKRGIPSGFVAIKKVGIPGEQLRTTEESTGLEEVDALGFGCVLLKTSTLDDMPDPIGKPWFQNEYMGDMHWMGEDVHFCKLYRESGQRVFVDHDLSKQCRHIGQFEYALEHAEIHEEVAA